MKIFFSVGEPSGDIHGANLIRQLRRLRPDVECVGYGGPEMAAAGCQLHADLTALAVMWILRVLINLHKFLDLASRADRYFRHHRPDAVVLIDYPGFNWWIARRAKAHGIPVLYYCPPQIWSWASWRIKKMRRLVDHVLCALPFEAKWFKERGCRATFVGHPFFDEVRRHPYDQELFVSLMAQPGPLVAILPGSRTQEVEHNLKWFLKAAALVQVRVPNVRFAIAAFKPQHAQMAREMLVGKRLPAEVYIRKTPELIQAADCCMACSGSVSLELLYHKKPTVILYWISQFAYRVQGFFVHVKYITLVNLLSTKEPFFRRDKLAEEKSVPPNRALFPEYLTYEDKSLQLAGHVIGWLTDAEGREGVVAELAKLKAEIAHGGASAVGADLILKEADSRKRIQTPKPHFQPGMHVDSNGGADAAFPAPPAPISSRLGVGSRAA
ncbi:MAG TPA: lipid-A-disaccharide synthase [Pirellulales bacterium]|jgi:lipid-A-disaccharide synthase